MRAPGSERMQWVVKMLAVDPSDCILEIGCGRGAAVSLICSELVDGTIVAIDRSAKMIEAAKSANAGYIAEGKASFISAPLDEADLPRQRFDKIFAVNVNLFWMKADRELAVIGKLLRPGGAVYIFNQPPVREKAGEIAKRTVDNLLKAGFRVNPVVTGDMTPAPVICVIASRDNLAH